MDLSWEEARDTLRDWRDNSVRESDRIVEIGERLVRKYSSKLKDELWLVCEQVLIAALDVRRYDVVDLCLDKLNRNFPNSLRVSKLLGMKMESLGEFDEALKLYKEIQQEDPTNAAVQKRMIAISKCRDSPGTTIKLLTEYLDIFMADKEAWMELADLYIAQMDYDRAAFCFEELILSNAFNHLYHQRYAEIKYSKGGTQNKEIARQYFAQAVKLSNNCNMRALYGLLLTSTSLCTKSSESKSKQYASWAAKMISEKYKEVWGKNGLAGIDGTRQITPSNDVPQLIASVTDSITQLRLHDGSA